MTPYYADDLVTIYHADARETPVAADAVVTDPPYPGREDLFDTTAVEDVLTSAVTVPAFVFWPVLAPYPVRTPDAVHIWHKAVPIHPNSITGDVAGHQYERILDYGIGKRCEVFRVAAVLPGFAAAREEFSEHPTQKPLVLMTQLVARTCGVVFDPFMGSGTTLVAAKSLGRAAIGVEIEERYCEIAARRCSQEVLGLVA